MTRPTQSLLWMAVFLVIVALACLAIGPALHAAFTANAGFNGFIVCVFVIGVVINVRQVVMLYREIRWADDWRLGTHNEPQTQPRLLAPMALMLSGRSDMSLSATAMRALLDSIRTRLDESRELSRYVIGVLVFLGLLGTFWGLMATVGSVSSLIAGMEVDGAEASEIFNSLKTRLEGPLGGMGVAFSSSLFGLSGSLIVGFVDLQAAHAQNRFVNELEQWLSGNTRLSSGVLGDDGVTGGAPAYVEALLEKTAETLERMQRGTTVSNEQGARTNEQIAALSAALNRFNTTNSEHQQQLALAAEQQRELIHKLEQLLRHSSDNNSNEALGEEIRLLSRTLANALAARDK